MRFGLLGTGYWAATAHGAGLVAHPGADLVGVWGRDPGKADVLAQRLGARPYADIDALLADVDAVAIALPPDVQADLAVRAAQHGAHLLLDKPLAITPAAAGRVADAVDAARVSSVVYFTARFDPAVDAWLREVADTGGWEGARGAWLSSIFQPGSPFADSAWRREKGALWDLGPHALALVTPALGAVERVTAAGGPGDTVHLVLGHAGGSASALSLSLTAPPAARTTELSLYGSGGSSAMPARGDADTYAAAVDQLVAAATAGQTEHPMDVRFAREVTAVLAVAEAALEEGSTRRVR